VATVALRRPAALDRSLAGVRVPTAVGLTVLVALSLVLRTGRMGVPFWIDEGLSVGIGSRSLTDIPGVLERDGSPPLYYMLLHVWMRVFGTSEEATHALSLIFALAAIPVAYWAARSLFGPRAGWMLAALTALNPFLTSYAQETRMYSLVVLLGTLCTAFFLHAYVYGRRQYRIPFGLALAALLYTHNWTFFYGVGLVIALALVHRGAEDRRALLRDVAVGFGVAAALYLPWVPTLIFQALHTGAPWATPPSLTTLVKAPNLLLGGQSGTFVVLLAAGAGVLALGARRDRRVLVPGLVALAVAPIVTAWLLSQVSPAWATRYLAVAVPPLLLLAALGLSRAGRIGLAGFALLAVSWAFASAPSAKSNVALVAEQFENRLQPGDIVISSQPEQLPVLSYYMPDGLEWHTPFGPQRDLGVTDWRDGAEHFDRTGVRQQLMPLLDGLRVGQQLLLVRPIIFYPERWEGEWTSRVRDRSIEYEGVLRGDPRLRVAAIVPQSYRLPGPNPVQGLLFVKVRD
jgi:hypothetical protein